MGQWDVFPSVCVCKTRTNQPSCLPAISHEGPCPSAEQMILTFLPHIIATAVCLAALLNCLTCMFHFLKCTCMASVCQLSPTSVSAVGSHLSSSPPLSSLSSLPPCSTFVIFPDGLQLLCPHLTLRLWAAAEQRNDTEVMTGVNNFCITAKISPCSKEMDPGETDQGKTGGTNPGLELVEFQDDTSCQLTASGSHEAHDSRLLPFMAPSSPRVCCHN